MINVALPKGRLGEKVYAMFERAGYECPELLEPNRKLIFIFGKMKSVPTYMGNFQFFRNITRKGFYISFYKT